MHIITDRVRAIVADPDGAALPTTADEALAIVRELLAVVRDRAAAIQALQEFRQPVDPARRPAVSAGTAGVTAAMAEAQAQGRGMPDRYVDGLVGLMAESGIFTPTAIEDARQSFVSGSAMSAALHTSLTDVLTEAHQAIVTALVGYGARLRWEARWRFHANLLNLDGTMPVETIRAALRTPKFRLIQETARVLSAAMRELDKTGPHPNLWEIVETDEAFPLDIEALGASVLAAERAAPAARRR